MASPSGEPRGETISRCADYSVVSGLDRHGVIGVSRAESRCRWARGCRGDSRVEFAEQVSGPRRSPGELWLFVDR